MLFCELLLSHALEPLVAEVIGRLETVPVTRTPEVPNFYNALNWTSPVPQPTAISSPFGPRWKISSDRYDFHRGIDYFDVDDTELYAIADGVVFQHREFTDGGTTTIVEHELENPSGAYHKGLRILSSFEQQSNNRGPECTKGRNHRHHGPDRHNHFHTFAFHHPVSRLLYPSIPGGEQPSTNSFF